MRRAGFIALAAMLAAGLASCTVDHARGDAITVTDAQDGSEVGPLCTVLDDLTVRRFEPTVFS